MLSKHYFVTENKSNTHTHIYTQNTPTQPDKEPLEKDDDEEGEAALVENMDEPAVETNPLGDDDDDDEEEPNNDSVDADDEAGDDAADEDKSEKADEVSPSPALDIEGVVIGEADNGGVQSEGGQLLPDDTDEVYTHIHTN